VLLATLAAVRPGSAIRLALSLAFFLGASCGDGMASAILDSQSAPAPQALPPPPAMSPEPTTPPPPMGPDYSSTDPFKDFLKGDDQLAQLCARNNQDPVSRKLCATPKPVITSLVDLQKALGLDFQPGNTANGTLGNPAFVLTGHSSSLVTRFVSAINPRALIFTPAASNGRVSNPVKNAGFIAMGFVRGEQFSELVARDPVTKDLSFFLVRFEHACNADDSCGFADLLTPEVESGFTSVTVYEDVDIKNTIFDCLQCHQPGGPGTPKILRMQELQNPWTHFFRNNRPGGQALLADFMGAHEGESYAGIPAAAINNSDPARLEGLVENEGFQAQPNEFKTGTIESEVAASGTTPGTSATWEKLYANVYDGGVIPMPYHDVKVTDPTKVGPASANYKEVLASQIPREQMLDIRDVFLDEGLADMNFVPQPGSSGAQIMKQICQHCHNSTLDQNISRANFDILKLPTMDRHEKDVAIARVSLRMTNPKSRFMMPPARFATLPPWAIDAVIAELNK
jgi:hypothetical protein